MEKKIQHIPVLLQESITALNIKNDGFYVDATFGMGGHSKAILSCLGKKGKLIAIDCDPYSIDFSRTIKDSRFSIIHGQFSSIENYLLKRKLHGKINGILFDLGMSSMQVDDPLRGFSFLNNGNLDMRMNPSYGLSAKEKLKYAKEEEICWILKTYGEEKFAKKIAREIFLYNQKNTISTTKELTNIVIKSIRFNKKLLRHPATRTFQAIRIWVNNELNELKTALKKTSAILAPYGRLVIISFHSLETRIIKEIILEKNNIVNIPKNIPLYSKQLISLEKNFKILPKIKPSKQEIANNPRSRSAILRIAEKLKK
ncbi:16S rRNA (cytosine(1402)-N(4))-methyltransferase RsmH [Candidatus Tachikawaea gelatinosa]|uniref:Ribosomal RNA small subunit methyltransferase H n=1 Tax=Candidatus Tachikawaea gelatinosa TaxID=1410383 RepID=A0A090AQ47_9ENTR|nr:16S rRNA (cytosine(1402)-N(4))-methyltransferase RsmH [Candidatus Tachikawaea gelatinosa]BAP58467.1 ribosomal RNA small subunit methyltransferase H [Candidatus Tachikawaea gelatinosa]